MSTLAEFAYHIIEKIDGEKGLRLIPYKTAERLKWYLLKFID